MKSLIIKDIIVLKQVMKSLLLVMIVWFVMAFVMKTPAFFSGLSVMMAIMIPLNTISYDEKAKWNSYVLSMPVSKKDIVLSKYIIGALAAIVVCVFAFALGLLQQDINIVMPTCLASLGIGILMLDIILPLIFKFGVEKSRMIFLLVFIIPMALAFLMPKLNIPIPSPQTIKLLISLSPVIIAGITVVSAAMSLGILKRKEA